MSRGSRELQGFLEFLAGDRNEECGVLFCNLQQRDREAGRAVEMTDALTSALVTYPLAVGVAEPDPQDGKVE